MLFELGVTRCATVGHIIRSCVIGLFVMQVAAGLATARSSAERAAPVAARDGRRLDAGRSPPLPGTHPHLLGSVSTGKLLSLWPIALVTTQSDDPCFRFARVLNSTSCPGGPKRIWRPIRIHWACFRSNSKLDLIQTSEFQIF